ncbi:MAG TPA: hypothetical protein VGK20_02920 [Candidatus Binatia bacterium]
MRDPGHAAFEIDDARREVLRRHAQVIAGSATGDAPVTAAHAFRPPADLTPSQALGLLAAALLVMLSGLAGGALVEAVGVRTAAALLLAIALAASLGLRGLSPGHHDSLSAFERIALLAMPAVAVATDSAVALALVPAAVHAIVAGVMLASLDDEASLIEKAARISQPLAPDFIGPYCRKLTAAWGLLFAASAVVTTVLALGGNVDAAQAWTDWQLWLLIGVSSAAEFLWRKAWFRYYGQGPLDRVLARMFPSANTERGRRSQAWAMQMRTELARLAEIERSAGRC